MPPISAGPVAIATLPPQCHQAAPQAPAHTAYPLSTDSPAIDFRMKIYNSACAFTLLVASVACADIYRHNDVAAQTPPAASIVAPDPDAAPADTILSADPNNLFPSNQKSVNDMHEHDQTLVQSLKENYNSEDIKFKNEKLAKMIEKLITEELEAVQLKSDGAPESSQIDKNKKYSQIIGSLFSQLLQIPLVVLHAFSDAVAQLTASAASAAAVAAGKPIHNSNDNTHGAPGKPNHNNNDNTHTVPGRPIYNDNSQVAPGKPTYNDNTHTVPGRPTYNNDKVHSGK